MRTAVLPLSLLLAASLTGCGTLRADHDACPETYEDSGLVDGIDLAVPDWLPEGFPLPEGISIRHISRAHLSPAGWLTGFVPNGDPETLAAGLASDLSDGGYEILFSAVGFVSPAHDALVALRVDPPLLTTIDLAPDTAPVRVEGERCRLAPGVLVSVRIEGTDPGQARDLYAGTSLTPGSARASIGGREYLADGTCYTHAGQRTFGATSGAFIHLQVEVSPSDAIVFGFASVDVVDEATFALDLTPVSGVEPVFEVPDRGFAAGGMFIDAFGDLGLVPGRVEASCG
jgi:hypothetical protein